ncbi:MAG: hypothetical protein F4103_08195 [Boseongicola sp. SB0673_bin_14]|nr:hypothetical protein [Boseongicola sp. SB0673_bin_14]
MDIADRVTSGLGQLFNRGGNAQPQPTDALQLLDLMNRRGGSRKALAEYLLFSGGLSSIIRQPVVYQTNDGTGRIRYGSDLGYSLVRRKNGSQELIFQIPTEIGKMLGFVKARRKPVISVRDTQAIKRAARAKDRVYKLAKEADLCVKKGTRRC